ncbi:MAG: NEW3 domain-containing protein [Desulfatiglandaceae bacterium]
MKFKRDNSFFLITMILSMVFSLSMFFSPFAFGEEKKKQKDLPERGIAVSPEYPGIIISQEEENVSIDLDVTNRGSRDENIFVSLTSIPPGWKGRIKTYSFGVTGVHVKSDTSKNLTLRVEPEPDLETGTYTFGIEAQTEDKEFKSTSQVIITVEEKKAEEKPEGVKITTSYPVLRGPTDAEFEFSLEVDNKLDKDMIYNLSAQGPENWEINFKPAYEDKFISSLRLKANQSQSMAIAVKPFPLAKPGEYPIRVKVSSTEAKGEVELTVVLTGTYKLDAGTATGLLSLNAVRGKEGNLSVYVKNSGSAILNNVAFMSIKPENWKVEFSPENLEALPPGELKQVEVSITPAEQALVGDYSVGIRADAGKLSKNLELRVTVLASTAWGWIGIGIIVLVMLGLVVLFIRLGRR